MSHTQNDPDAAIPTRHFCDGCKQGTTSKLDCANLEKIVCFTRPRRDHFSGDCDNLIRKSNPPSSVPAFWSSLPLRRLFPTISTRSPSTPELHIQSTDGASPTPCESKEYTERKEVETQLLDWQDRCNDALRLLRACDREEAADALELQRPDLRGWKEPSEKEYTHVHEYEKVANIFSDQILVTRDSSRRLTRRKQHLNATKKFCLAIFQKLEAFDLAEAAMDPLTRWHIDPKSSAIESESQKMVSHIPTTAPNTAGSMANFVDLMHTHITNLYEMPGDTLYSRYTIAFNLIQTAVRWKFTGTTFTQNSVHNSSISAAEITRLFRPLDTQFKGILKEGLMRKGGLPWDQALCFLETHGVERLYPASWGWLRELFHYEDVSQKYVPLTIIKGAGHEYIPIPEGESAIVADFHSIRTQTTDSPTYLTSGFYRIKAGPTRNIPTYDYEETKYVLNGQIDVLDEATGVTHHLVAGDFAFFHVGSKAQFSSKSGGTAFFAVTRPVITQHPGLKGREEKVLSKL